MSTVIALIKILIACVPFALLLLAVGKINLKKLNRGRQFAMPLVVLGYFLVLLLLALWCNARIRIQLVDTGESVGCVRFWLTYTAAQKVECLQRWLQSRFNTVTGTYDFGGLISLATPVMEQVVEAFVKYLMFAINTAVVLLFLPVKAIALPILSGIWGKKPALESATSGHFYEFDEEYHIWFLQARWRDYAGLIRAAYLASVLVGAVLLGLSRMYYEVRVFQSVLAPVLVSLLLGEIFCLLGGYTRSEYEQDILGADAQSRQVVNLSKLRDTLKRIFGDRLLLEGTELENGGKSGVTDLLERMADGDRAAQVSAAYFQILQAEGVPLDVDSVASATNLLRHESVLFCNPFYWDLTQYFLLPMSDTLMNRRKCLVIAGRKSTEPEIRRWMEASVQEHLKMSGLWRVGSVADDEGEFEIGILPFSQLYNLDMLHARRDFFHQVGLVLILEPSLILATGQVGLSLVVNYCDEDGEQPTYCMCDRNCDGLVDTLSHMIKQSITIVSATESPTCLHSELCWHSDGEYLHRRILPDISRYLGVGTELAAASVKEQVPRVVWRSENKFPVVDMKWIAGQYYGPISQYANLPRNQEAVYQAIGFEADLWGTRKEKNACLIVEDEFCNLLEMVRVFLTRAEEQAFINVISENYLLRDYMTHNYRIFSADQKAIPTIVADYARTERNTTIRLIMMLVMSDSVAEELVEKELRLVGIQSGETCETVNRLIAKYTFETRPLVVPVLRDAITGLELQSGSESRLQIPEDKKASFLERIGMSFQTAYYITEDDKEGSSFMDAKLFGHIYQANLPGQFFTYDGKYYEVRSVTAEKGVLVRRAADHIVGRRYYRQKRSYYLTGLDAESSRSRMVNGIEATIGGYQISVETDGYFELDESNNIRTAKEVRFADDEAQASQRFEYTRTYHHKNVLRLRLPDASEEVRYTLCLLLMEVFRTVYADAWHYLAAVTAQTEATRDALRGMLYALNGDMVEQDCIYIIEDSDVDMGLLESVDRNLDRLLGILADYLDWHTEMCNTPDPPSAGPTTEVQLPPEEKEKGFFARLFGRIGAFLKRLLHIKDKTPAEG
ncbi:MAG: hypothetical protein IJ751_05965, partial [Oscillospiraceae bacterium]|nr:hypothetical protein [Oscillospiraceae bacterium]